MTQLRLILSVVGTARTVAWTVTTFAAALIAAGCSDDGSSDERVAETSSALVGQCVRNEPLLRSPTPDTCATDANCPCGSFCDPVEHVCAFTCMVPPANLAESCAAGTQCDDHGRCVAPNATPATLAPVLAVNPPILEVLPSGGTATQLTAQLAVHANGGPLVTQAQTTVVRVVASEDIEVSCDAATFGHACELTTWSFSWDGARMLSSKPFWARTVASNTDGHGDVTLHIGSTETELVVPSSSGATSVLDGTYVGVATSAGIANGVPVAAVVHGSFVVVRDASRIIAPDGALVLDLLDDTADVATARRTVWLRSPGTTGDAAAVVGEYRSSGLVAFNAATGALTAGFSIALPGPQAGPVTDTWTLQLQRSTDRATDCTVNSDCAAGSECPSGLQVCVPSAVWTPTTTAVGNGLEDARSLTWWNAISGLLGTSDATPANSAFATTGADLIETLLCTTSSAETEAGRLGVRQLKQTGQPSRSGDLACVANSGAPNLVPGAVGLVTYADREGSAASLPLLGTCLADLARVPAGFTFDFASTTGKCANLARFVPALRLLATGELGKRAQATDARTRGLFVRLVQQWTQLHGFVASTGLSEREYDDAVAASPAEARQELVSLLDVIDAGWAALLDKRIAPTVSAAATWAPSDTDVTNDYREAKRPLVYWTFNDNSNPNRDLVRGLDLTQRITSGIAACQITATRDSLDHGYNCPGFRATLPPDAPGIGGNQNLTVSMYIDAPTAEFPPYFGGTLFQTETLAAVSEPLGRDIAIAFVHPTADGGTEWVSFNWVYGLAADTIAIVRDTQAMTYTLYVYEAWQPQQPVSVFTQRYYHQVGGVLPGTAERRIALLNGNVNAIVDRRATIGQFPHAVSFAGVVDDFAIWNSAISKREFTRFARARGVADNHRDIYPESMALAEHGTQEIKVPVGATLLESEVAHLEVAARLGQQLTYEAQAACEDKEAAAVAIVDAGIARAGQAVRQSFLVENLAKADTSERAGKARKLLQVKRSLIARTLQRLRSCENPFGMTEGEVPLYFGDISGEVAAFFAASDHLLSLAEPRAAAAKAALDNGVRVRWEQARQSQIQQLQDDNSRAIRVDEVQSRFGDQLKRLCGIPDQTAAQIMQQVKDGTFSIDTCYVKPTQACLAKHASGPIMDADPTCYRGVIGGALMDMRAAYHAQQAAYQSWKAAVGNADGAEKQCVLKEMDVFGCTALDRHKLEGVSCPAGHQGTLQLVEEFNDYLDEKEEEKAWFDAVVSTVATAAAVATAVATTGPGAGFLVAASGSLGLLSGEMGRSMEARKRRHEAVLQARALEDDIRACWTSSDQFQRAIAAAEEASKEASDRMQSATINFENALSEGREAVLEGPIVLEREQTRPSIPIAFHYWLADEMTQYRFLLDSARRYAYVALRATEYDTQESYATPQPGKPSRAAVLGAWRPDDLVRQVSLMRSQTDNRKLNARPAKAHMIVDVARDVFGLDSPDQLTAHLEANARPVYSKRGEYLGQGVRFSFLPSSAVERPSWRCAERIFRANVASTGFSDSVHVKLLKRTVFGSRSCTSDKFQVATLRPQTNLLVASGEPQTYADPATHTVADINMVNLDTPATNDAWTRADDFTNGASTELAGQGLYGDYVLLFTAPSLNAGLSLSALADLSLRFDFLSIDNLPQTNLLRKGDIEVDSSRAPIVVD